MPAPVCARQRYIKYQRQYRHVEVDQPYRERIHLCLSDIPLGKGVGISSNWAVPELLARSNSYCIDPSVPQSRHRTVDNVAGIPGPQLVSARRERFVENPPKHNVLLALDRQARQCIAMNSTAPPTIFCRLRRAAKWARLVTRSKLPDAADYLLRDAVDDVVERMDFMRLDPKNALVIGDWTDLLPSVLKARGAAVTSFPIGAFDEEHPIAGGPYDLVIHVLGLSTVNDLPGALIHSKNALADGGLMIATFPGAGSLPKLREAMLAADGERPAARIHPMVDNQSAAGLLQRAGFKRQVVDSHTLSVRFSSLDRLVSDLRDHGMNNALMNSAPHICRGGLQRAKLAFKALAEHDGKVKETFEMMTLTGWK